MKVCKTDTILLSTPHIEYGVLIFDTYNPVTGKYVKDDIFTHLSIKWNNIQDKPIFSNVGISGDYNDLINKPTIPNTDNLFVQWDNVINRPDIGDYVLQNDFDNNINSINSFAFFPNKVELSDVGSSIIENGKIKSSLLSVNLDEDLVVQLINTNTQGLVTRVSTLESQRASDIILLNSLNTSVQGYNSILDTQNTKINILTNLLDGKASNNEFQNYKSSVTSQLSTINNNITTHTTQINQNTNSLLLKANKTELNTLTDRVTNAESTINIQGNQILLKASQSQVTGLDQRLNTAEAQLVIQANEIATKVSSIDLDDMTDRITNNESQLTIQAGQIATKVSQSTFDTLSNTVSSQQTSITQNTNSIALKASQSTVDGLTNRITSAETSIVQNANNITLKANESTVNSLNTRVTNAESAITQNANQITLKVNQSTFDTLNNKVNTQESAITQNANNIALKVSETDFNGTNLISKINLDPGTIKLSANKINLDGSVTIGSFDSALQNQYNTALSDIITLYSTKNYVDNILPGQLSDLENALDGLTEQYFYTTDPSNSSVPTSDWIINSTQADHLGDLYYNTTSGKSWRYVIESSVYQWKEIVNSDLQTALDAASKAQDTADGKRRVFTLTPFVPYDKGDLWVQGSSGDIMISNANKTISQSYNVNDWVKASKYTDNTVVNTLIGNLKGLAYEDVVELAKLGTTVIENGKIKTVLLDADYIKANIVKTTIIDADHIDTKGLTIKNLAGDIIFSATEQLDGVYIKNVNGGTITSGDISKDRIKEYVIDAINNNTVKTINASRINTSELVIGQNISTTYIDNKVANLAVGTSNLIRNSEFKRTPLLWSKVGTASYTYNPLYVEFTNLSNSNGYLQNLDYDDSLIGKTYTYSFEFYPLSSGLSYKIGLEQNPTSLTLHNTPEWKKYIITFTATSNNKAVIIYNNNPSASSFRLRNFQLVEGNAISPSWTINSKDLTQDSGLLAKDVATDTVNNIQIGGDNLLINSSYEDVTNLPTLTSYDSSGTVSFVNTESFYGSRSVSYTVNTIKPITGVYVLNNRTDLITKIKNNNIVLSVMVKGVGTSIGKTVKLSLNNGVQTYTSNDLILSDIWQQLVLTTNIIPTSTTITAYIHGNFSVNDKIFYDCSQLQIGQKATQWSASPEDLKIVIDKYSYKKNLVRASNTKFKRDTGATSSVFATYYLSDTLLKDTEYTLIVKGTNTGGTFIGTLDNIQDLSMSFGASESTTKAITIIPTADRSTLSFKKVPSSNTGACTIDWVVIYRGSSEGAILEWTPSPDDLSYEIYKYTSDDIVTAIEKKSLKITYEEIVSEYSRMITIANSYDVVTTNYTNSYNSVVLAISPLLTADKINLDSNISIASGGIGRVELNNRIITYSNSLNNLRESIDVKASTSITGIIDFGNDNKLTALEKKSVKVFMIEFNQKVAEIQQKVTATNNGVSITAFNSAQTALANYLNPKLSGTMINTTETIVRSEYETLLNNYTTALKDIELALSTFNNNKLDNKTSVFKQQPTSGYKIGDLLIPDSNITQYSTTLYAGQIYTAKITSLSGFSVYDWTELAKQSAIDGKADFDYSFPSTYKMGTLVLLTNNINISGNFYTKGLYISNQGRDVPGDNIKAHWQQVDANVDLSNYVTSSDLANSLGNYPTTSQLNSTLTSYVTNSGLTSAMNGTTKIYSSPSGLTNYKIGDYIVCISDINISGTVYYKDRIYLCIGNYSSTFKNSDWKETAYTSDIQDVSGDIADLTSDILLLQSWVSGRPNSFYLPSGSTPTNYKVNDVWYPLTTFNYDSSTTYYKGSSYKANTTSVSFNKNHWDIIGNAGFLTDILLNGSTEAVPGLILTNFLGLKSLNGGSITSYINGDTTKANAFAAGVINFNNLGGTETQRILFRHDGSGHLASGKITFDNTGKATIGGFIIDSTSLKTSNIGYNNQSLVLDAENNIFKFYSGKLTTDGISNFDSSVADISINTNNSWASSYSSNGFTINSSGIVDGTNSISSVFSGGIEFRGRIYNTKQSYNGGPYDTLNVESKVTYVNSNGIFSNGSSTIMFPPSSGRSGNASIVGILQRGAYSYFKDSISAAIVGFDQTIDDVDGNGPTYGGYFNSVFTGALHIEPFIVNSSGNFYLTKDTGFVIIRPGGSNSYVFLPDNSRVGHYIMVKNYSGSSRVVYPQGSGTIINQNGSSVSSVTIPNGRTYGFYRDSSVNVIWHIINFW